MTRVLKYCYSPDKANVNDFMEREKAKELARNAIIGMILEFVVTTGGC